MDGAHILDGMKSAVWPNRVVIHIGASSTLGGTAPA